MRFGKTLFIFRRDLRLEDNTGLIYALENSETVIPAFIFTPEQINDNPYRSDHCLRFMLESLEDLNKQLKQQGSRLYIFEGSPEKIVAQCVQDLKINAVAVNKDYTPYSRNRDEKILEICKAHTVEFLSFDDALLHPPEDTLKSDGTPYTVFTPYFKNASKLEILPPLPNTEHNYYQDRVHFAKDDSFLQQLYPKSSIKNTFKGGRTEALKLLKQLGNLNLYEERRNIPTEDYSSHLSAYLKFTVCSAREVYAEILHTLGKNHELIRSLFWRDFFTSIAYFFPHVFQGAFRTKFDTLSWSQDTHVFKLWCQGKTGFPIVDAGMRELNETGFMHNRVRMITGSFLVKDLHIDWRWGEKYFAQTLVDYDPAVNNGNWQWVASTGCDAQPYFRIFNPWNQQKKFDPECLYIKKWVPELRTIPAKIIHELYDQRNHSKCPDYPIPLVQHEVESKKALEAYRNV